MEKKTRTFFCVVLLKKPRVCLKLDIKKLTFLQYLHKIEILEKMEIEGKFI
jgi:hypothetical protein